MLCSAVSPGDNCPCAVRDQGVAGSNPVSPTMQHSVIAREEQRGLEQLSHAASV